MNHDNNYRKGFAQLGALLICRAANLHGLELENLTVMLALYFAKKREWSFFKTCSWAPWFYDKPDQEYCP